MSTKQAPTVAPEHGQIGPSTAGDIVYKAFARPYDSGGGQVLTLLASCSYPSGNWEIFFVGAGNGTYRLMEQQPQYFFGLLTYYAADFTTGFGLSEPVQSVVIEDASGSHTIPVQSF